MGSIPNHSNSAPYLSTALSPQSSQFMHKIQSMKFNNNENKLKRNKAETQLEIAKALNVLQQNKYLFADNQIKSVKEENKLYKIKRTNTHSTVDLKLPQINSKKGAMRQDVSFKYKKVRSSTNNQLFSNPKTTVYRNVLETDGE